MLTLGVVGSNRVRWARRHERKVVIVQRESAKINPEHSEVYQPSSQTWLPTVR